jgi:hypothetical protein
VQEEHRFALLSTPIRGVFVCVCVCVCVCMCVLIKDRWIIS